MRKITSLLLSLLLLLCPLSIGAQSGEHLLLTDEQREIIDRMGLSVWAEDDTGYVILGAPALGEVAWFEASDAREDFEAFLQMWLDDHVPALDFTPADFERIEQLGYRLWLNNEWDGVAFEASNEDWGHVWVPMDLVEDVPAILQLLADHRAYLNGETDEDPLTPIEAYWEAQYQQELAQEEALANDPDIAFTPAQQQLIDTLGIEISGSRRLQVTISGETSWYTPGIQSQTLYEFIWEELAWRTASDERISGDGAFRYAVVNDKAILLGLVKDTKKKLVLPEQLDGYPVVAIGYGAFFQSAVPAVTLPSTLLTLDRNPFQGVNLQEILVAEGNEALQSIDGVLFSADGAELILYPRARKGKSYEVPEGVLSIGYAAFIYCANLTEVLLPQGIETLGDLAFANMNKMKALTLPNTIRFIAPDALPGVDFSLEEGNPYLEVRDGALLGDGGKTVVRLLSNEIEQYDIPEGVEVIAKKAFADREQLASITFPESLRIVGGSAFSHTRLERVEFHEGLEVLADFAFWYGSLKEAVLPESLTTIGRQVFMENHGLTIIAPEGSAAQEYAQWDGVSFVPSTSN